MVYIAWVNHGRAREDLHQAELFFRFVDERSTSKMWHTVWAHKKSEVDDHSIASLVEQTASAIACRPMREQETMRKCLFRWVTSVKQPLKDVAVLGLGTRKSEQIRMGPTGQTFL